MTSPFVNYTMHVPENVLKTFCSEEFGPVLCVFVMDECKIGE